MTPKKAEKLKILDPACGSGSFLIGAYKYLLDYHLDWYRESGPEKYAKGKRPAVYRGMGGEWRLTTQEKKRILINNIFGVDIDRQAVEVTKLSLLLKVLEDESGETLGKNLALFRERALPNLKDNIKCGNSLIGPDFYDNPPLIPPLQGGIEGGFKEVRRINAFDWNDEENGFGKIMRAGGFDAVIGNPPYVRIQAMKEWAPIEVEEYKRRYKAASKGNYDIYTVFVEKGLSLLNEKGLFGYILPHKFFQAQYGEPLRQIISEGKYLAKVIDFGHQQVFTGATTYTCLLFLNRGGVKKVDYTKVKDLNAWHFEPDDRDVIEKGKIPISSIAAEPWNFVVGKGAKLFEKLSRMPHKLNEVAEIFQGLVTGFDKAYILDSPHNIESQLLHPYLKSCSLSPYDYPITLLWMLFPYYIKDGKAKLIPEVDFIRKYPIAWKHLKRYERYLRNREHGKWNHEGWYAYGRSQNLSRMDGQKLIIQVLSLGPRVIYDNRNIYMTGGGGGPFYGIRPKKSSLSFFFLLGVLNSRLFGQFVSRTSTPMRGGYIRFSKQYLKDFPIRAIDFNSKKDKAAHDKMVALVDSMLELNKKLRQTKTPHDRELIERRIKATDNRIDRLVYGLYGLTEEEVRVVEGS